MKETVEHAKSFDEIEKLFEEAIAECYKAGVPISKDIAQPLRINTGIKARFAGCRFDSRRQTYCLELSSEMLASRDTKIKEVLIHELIHTCPGCLNHGKKWKAYAAKMNEAFGYNIKTRTTYEELGLEPPQKKETAHWEITCTRCGQSMTRMRRSPLVSHPARYRCKCGGKLTVKEIKK